MCFCNDIPKLFRVFGHSNLQTFLLPWLVNTDKTRNCFGFWRTTKECWYWMIVPAQVAKETSFRSLLQSAKTKWQTSVPCSAFPPWPVPSSFKSSNVFQRISTLGFTIYWRQTWLGMTSMRLSQFSPASSCVSSWQSSCQELRLMKFWAVKKPETISGFMRCTTCTYTKTQNCFGFGGCRLELIRYRNPKQFRVWLICVPVCIKTRNCFGCFAGMRFNIDRSGSSTIDPPVSYDVSSVKNMKKNLDENKGVAFNLDPASCVFFFRPFNLGDEQEGLELVAGMVTTVSLFAYIQRFVCWNRFRVLPLEMRKFRMSI